MRLIAYARVSTAEQATEGVSLDAQEERFKHYAAAFGHEIVTCIRDEGVSAKTLKRPGLQRALKMLRKREAEGLLIVKLDRLSRSVIGWAELIEKYFNERSGLQLASVSDNIDTSNASGRLVLNVLVAVAQWEREAIAERTSEALQHKKRQGARLGAVPLGFRRAGDHLVEDAGEQLVLARVRALVKDGIKPSEIRRTLEREDFKTKRGGAWHLTTIRKLIARATAALVVFIAFLIRGN